MSTSPASPFHLMPSVQILHQSPARSDLSPGRSYFSNFAALSTRNDVVSQEDHPSTYVHKWLRRASFAKESPSDSLAPQQMFHPVSPQVRRPNDAPGRMDVETKYHSPSSPFRTSLRQSHHHQEENGRNTDVDFFGRNSLDLRFDLEKKESVGVVEAASGNRPHSSSILDQHQFRAEDNTIPHDPFYDGTSEDERILRRNMRNPWPYDRQNLMPQTVPSTNVLRDPFTAAPPRLASLIPSKRKRQPTFLPTLYWTASKLSSLSSSSVQNFHNGAEGSHKDQRIRNAGIPHPEWGTFGFRSDSDSLHSNDSDGDLQIWLRRVVRRNIRIGATSLTAVPGVYRPMTIEEYERCGSWLYESSEYEQECEHSNEYYGTRDLVDSPGYCTSASSMFEGVRGCYDRSEARGASDQSGEGSSLDYDGQLELELEPQHTSTQSMDRSSNNSIHRSSSIVQPEHPASHLAPLPRFPQTPVYGSLSEHGLPTSLTVRNAGHSIRKALSKRFQFRRGGQSNPTQQSAVPATKIESSLGRTKLNTFIPSCERSEVAADYSPARRFSDGTTDRFDASFGAHFDAEITSVSEFDEDVFDISEDPPRSYTMEWTSAGSETSSRRRERLH